MLYLNKQLFIFNKKDTKLCSYCRLTIQIFVKCKFAIKLRSNLGHYCQCSFDLPILNPLSVTFGFSEIDSDLVMFLIHTLLIRKYYVYASRDSLLKNIKKVFDLEKSIYRK